jgi:hypothetical protein
MDSVPAAEVEAQEAHVAQRERPTAPAAPLQFLGISISGYPVAAWDGLYLRTGELHEGVPRYTNGTKHLYYRPQEKDWCINNAFTPDQTVCSAWVAVTGVALPMGEHNWRCYVHKKWQSKAITTADAAERLAALERGVFFPKHPDIRLTQDNAVAKLIKTDGNSYRTAASEATLSDGGHYMARFTVRVGHCWTKFGVIPADWDVEERGLVAANPKYGHTASTARMAADHGGTPMSRATASACSSTSSTAT